MKRNVRTVQRARMMHRKGFKVSEISEKLRVPHQTVSDWIWGRRRPERRRVKFRTTERFDRLDEPAFDGRCPDCGGQMVNVLENRGAQRREHLFNSFWRCEGCGLNAKTLGGKIVSAWLGG